MVYKMFFVGFKHPKSLKTFFLKNLEFSMRMRMFFVCALNLVIRTQMPCKRQTDGRTD